MTTPELFNDILNKESVLLDAIISVQKDIRRDVTARDWESLENHIELLGTLSSDFQMFDEKRAKMAATGLKKEKTDYQAGNPLYHEVHQKLIKSRVENDSLNTYITVTRNFLQGVYDTVMPQRRNTLYSPRGMVRSQPDSMFLNTLS